jgi:hypothetical protein
MRLTGWVTVGVDQFGVVGAVGALVLGSERGIIVDWLPRRPTCGARFEVTDCDLKAGDGMTGESALAAQPIESHIF